MKARITFGSLAVALMALGGCASQGGSSEAPSEAAASNGAQPAQTTSTEAQTQGASMATGQCTTDGLKPLIGQPLDQKNRQIIVDESGATSYRMLRPDTPMGEGSDPSRLNITLDDEAVISAFSCG
ncbi:MULTISPECIES: I78 family peptidase inhibitor [Larsenimonas]|uniref:I78 family peptidase inhibitor n=1 Tax=Larsenimonas suaedae TaxID=1851019 RepID=A0ABU1GU18_9GAMM|nr:MULTISPECIES: I78 family peptidase inhibitor [Larsenimonas]MCM2972135.1 I78 family peptidase inhibitor [Larsenimonas suaedae]MCM5704309.1 I78 family peptidase inhibitor [Larsenimonas salina]MDR5895071.1 I78 family peptidase inhibitor [Larsenimonas suaedae]